MKRIHTSSFIILLILTKILYCSNYQNTQQPHNHTIYHIVQQYYNYSKIFSEKAGKNNTIQMTIHGTGTQICAGRACRYFIYLYQPSQKSKIQYNILLTSGMHGNQLIGPTTLLYLYPLLKPTNTRIIYFPITNPSGYQLKQRQTYPKQIDINRDYPIDGNQDCYRSSATRIIDKIFRQYQIDLTINLHNGGDQIAWNWGTVYNKKFPKTQQYQAYIAIGKMLKFYGGYNKRYQINQFKVGTMDQIIYPAEGTLDDWAYAGSWSQSAKYKCKQFMFQPYPKYMHKGLVFLLELGQHNTGENKLGTSEGLDQSSISNKIDNGYVTRAIRMLRELIKILDPVFSASIIQQQLYIKISGCEKIQNLTIQALIKQSLNNQQIDYLSQQNQANSLQISPQQIKTIQNSFSNIIKLSIKKTQLHLPPSQPQTNSTFIYYKYTCDKQWLGKGKTFISKQRKITGKIHLNLSLQTVNILKINGQLLGQLYQNYQTYLIISITLFIFLLLIAIKKYITKKKTIKFEIQKYKQNKNISNDISNNQQQDNNGVQLQYTQVVENINTEEHVQN